MHVGKTMDYRGDCMEEDHGLQGGLHGRRPCTTGGTAWKFDAIKKNIFVNESHMNFYFAMSGLLPPPPIFLHGKSNLAQETPELEFLKSLWG